MHTLVEIGLSNAVVACVPAALALAVSLSCRRPALAHALWLLVLIKLVTPPLFRIGLPWPAAGAEKEAALAAVEEASETAAEEAVPLPASRAAEAAVVVAEPAAPPALAAEEPAPVDDPGETVLPLEPGGSTVDWSELAGACWLVGSLGWFVLAGCRLVRFTRAVRLTRPAPAELADRVAELARAVGLRRGPAVVLAPGRLSPMVWGLFRPVLLVPEGLFRQMEASALDTLLVHELAHLARRDHWVRVLEFFALGVCWWNPLVWLARREIHEAEEQCCDAWVPRILPGAARTYATALVDVLDFLSEAVPAVPPLACGVGQVRDLKRRLKMILRGTTPHALGRTTALAVIGLALLLLPLVPAPARAQDEKPKPERPATRPIDTERGASDDLRRVSDALQQKLAEVEALKHKLDTLKKAQLEAQRVDALKQARVVRVAPPGVTIRIEISGLSGKSDEITRLARELQKAFPGKSVQVSIQPGGRHGAGTVLYRPVEVVRAPKGPFPAGSIEKKLDALMREMEALRKELRARPTPPPGPRPPVPPGPPAR